MMQLLFIRLEKYRFSKPFKYAKKWDKGNVPATWKSQGMFFCELVFLLQNSRKAYFG